MTTNANNRTADDPRRADPSELGLHPRRFTMRASLLEVICGAIMLLVAIAFWIGAGSIEGSTAGLSGPASFPRGIALILGVTSLVMAVRGARAMRSGEIKPTVEVKQPRAALANMALVIAYPVLISSFGYYMATGPWMIALFFAGGYRRLLPILACTAGFLIFTKLVFQMLIGIPLP